MALEHFPPTPEEMIMAEYQDPDDEPRNDRRAKITILINGTMREIIERKPGDLTDPDGAINAETRCALERYFATNGHGLPHHEPE